LVAVGVTLMGCSDGADDAEPAGPEAVATADVVEFAGVDFDVRRDPG
jgi:hypothetical protein